MSSKMKSVYTGEAKKTYDSVVKTRVEYFIVSKTYNESGSPVFYYIDAENFLHVFLIKRHPGNIGYYIITDNILTNRNSLKFNGYMRLQSAGITTLIDVLDGLVGTKVSTITDKE